MAESEITRAFCYLGALHDERNKAMLTDSHLLVIQKGKMERHELLQIKDLSFGHRKAMLFLLAGGIAVPLTAVAFYKDFLDPLPTLLLLFFGFFSMYSGWMGYEVLTIQHFTHDRDYHLPSISKNLRAFVEFCRKHLPVNSSPDLEKEKMIYHITTVKSWKQRCNGDLMEKVQGESFIHASSSRQLPHTLDKYFKGQNNLLLLSIDPLKVRAEIKYEDLSGEGQLFPHIYGNLNLDAIEKMEEISPRAVPGSS